MRAAVLTLKLLANGKNLCTMSNRNSRKKNNLYGSYGASKSPGKCLALKSDCSYPFLDTQGTPSHHELGTSKCHYQDFPPSQCQCLSDQALPVVLGHR